MNVGNKKARPALRSATLREPIVEPQKQGSFPASGPDIFLFIFALSRSSLLMDKIPDHGAHFATERPLVVKNQSSKLLETFPFLKCRAASRTGSI